MHAYVCRRDECLAYIVFSLTKCVHQMDETCSLLACTGTGAETHAAKFSEVTYITSSCFTRPHNPDNLSPLQPIVARDWVTVLNAWELVLLDLVALQQYGFLLRRQDAVLWHQLVLGDVDQQLRLSEALHNQLATDLCNHTPATQAQQDMATTQRKQTLKSTPHGTAGTGGCILLGCAFPLQGTCVCGTTAMAAVNAGCCAMPCIQCCQRCAALRAAAIQWLCAARLHHSLGKRCQD